MRKLSSAMLVSLFVLVVVCDPVQAAGKKKDRQGIFEVPTTGKIIDVEYRPEFDEWWVKCREGETISVYSYEPRSHTWGKVLFVPKKLEEQPAKVEPPANVEKERQLSERPVPAQVKPDSTRNAGKDEKKKWWDPIQILKETEKLMRP
jgi:hypothetical protein